MKLEVFADAEAVARAAAAIIAADARAAVAARGRFIMAVSGGKTPWVMLRALAGEQVPWKDVHVFQVDERIAPAGNPDRNLTHLRASLLEHAPLPPQQIYAMPVDSPDLEAAAKQYARTLAQAPKHPYTAALFSAALPIHPDERREEIILTGEVPSPLNPPSGCRFHPRCPQQMPICAQQEPALTPVTDRLVACHLYDHEVHGRGIH